MQGKHNPVVVLAMQRLDFWLKPLCSTCVPPYDRDTGISSMSCEPPVFNSSFDHTVAGWQHTWLIQHLIVSILLSHPLLIHHVPFLIASCILYLNTTPAWLRVLWCRCWNNFSIQSKNVYLRVSVYVRLAALFSSFHLFLCSLWMYERSVCCCQSSLYWSSTCCKWAWSIYWCPLAESGHQQRVPWCPVPVPGAGGVSARSAEWFQSNVALQRCVVKTLTAKVYFGWLAWELQAECVHCHFSQQTQPEFLKALVSWRPGWWVERQNLSLSFIWCPPGNNVLVFLSSLRFLQCPRQTWLPSAPVPLLGRPLASISPLSPWQRGWAPPPVPARRPWRRWWQAPCSQA